MTSCPPPTPSVCHLCLVCSFCLEHFYSVTFKSFLSHSISSGQGGICTHSMISASVTFLLPFSTRSSPASSVLLAFLLVPAPLRLYLLAAHHCLCARLCSPLQCTLSEANRCVPPSFYVIHRGQYSVFYLALRWIGWAHVKAGLDLPQCGLIFITL